MPCADYPAQDIRAQRFSRLSLILKSRRQVYRISGDGVFPVQLAAGAAGDNLAAGYANMSLQKLVTRSRERVHSFMYCESGTHGAHWVIAMSDGRPEDRHDIVADMLVDRTAIALDNR